MILSFDTSGPWCAAALLRDGEPTGDLQVEMGRGQAERLMPLLEDVLSETGAGWADLTRIAVGVGPGNFTGTRISVSAARGLSLALGIPAIGISTLEAAALGHDGPVLATAPAPRGQVYAELRGQGDIAAPELLDAEALMAAARDVPVTGFDPETLRLMAPDATVIAPRHSLPVAIATCAAQKVPDDCAPPAPLYLRPADAAPPRDAPPRIIP